MSDWRKITVAVCLTTFLASCTEKKQDPVPPRPVLWTTAALEDSRSMGFAGTIEPRREASLGFQTLGRIVTREVNIGDVVVEGQRLASIDDVAAQLALKIAESDLVSAEAQQTNAVANEKRQASLLDRRAVAQADVEAAQQARASADAAVLKARANVAKVQEQLGYTVLSATFAGVVTAVDAQVGQTVSAGSTVLTVAQPELRDAVVDIPDGMDEILHMGAEFTVAMQITPSVKATGKIREIAPDADPTTRTRRVRIALDAPPENMRLGTTITATLSSDTSAAIELPESAILKKDGKAFVWVIDPDKAVVSTREIALGKVDSRGVSITSGIEPGMRIVTAGVHSLTEGQTIRMDGRNSL